MKRKKQEEYQFPAHTHAEQPEFRCYACELAVCLADMERLLGLPVTMLQEVNIAHVRRTNGLAPVTYC